MTPQRASYFLLSLLSRALLKLQNWVLAVASKGSQKNNQTCSRPAVADVDPQPLPLQQLLQPHLQQNLLFRRDPQSKVALQQKLRRPPMLAHLSQRELEQAFQVVDAAWEAADGGLVEVQVPQSLRHLEADDWEHVTRLLLVLQHQQARSELH